MKVRGLLTGLAVCVAVLCARADAYAEEKRYEYGDEGIVNESLELKLEAEAGKNYDITVQFTGTEDTAGVINLGYDNVTNDQIVPNVHGGSDRSGLMGETVKAGVVETRKFSVAAVEDGITFKASGSGKIISVTVAEKAPEEQRGRAIFTIGDSLVQTYNETYAPQTGWGQMLQEYFDDDAVTVRNYALGGRSTGSYMREGRLNEVLLNIQPGDYVLIEFGHNDASKQKEDRYVSVEDYKVLLKECYARAIEQRGGIPVLVTLVNRNDYNTATGQFNVSFERYVEAMRETAAENNIKLIDLNAKTVEYFTELNKRHGVGITEAIIYNYAQPGQYSGAYADGVSDNTHLQRYGAKLVAGMVAEGLCDLGFEELKNAYIAPETYEGKPQKPEGIRIKNDQWRSGRIEWTAVKGADFYRVYVTEQTDGADGEFELAGYSTVNEFAYSDITMMHTYKFKVVAVNSAGESEQSEEFLFVAGDNNGAGTQKGDDNSDDNDKSDSPAIPITVVTAAAAAALVTTVIVLAVKKKKLK